MRIRRQMFSVFAVAVLMVVAAGCGNEDPHGQRGANIEAARALQPLHERQDAAWGESVEAVMAFWSEDVSITDVLGGWRDEPRAALAEMVGLTLRFWPNVDGRPPTYFVDTTGFVSSQLIWNIGDATEASPVHEVDQFDTLDGLFTFLHTTFTVETLARVAPYMGIELAESDVAAMEALVEAYAAAWSSGDQSSVAELYAETASRTNKLWGESAEGREAVSDAAARYFGSFPGAAWQVDFVFGHDAVGGDMTGGIFTVRLTEPDACELGAAVVLETNEAQKIVTERVYWELESLIRCGLATD